MNIWKLCKGVACISTISVEPWRVVEDQHVLSSRDLVDSVEEHDLLEELIEDSKPYVAKVKHYLIFTPFRYPPLKYGSRFGNTFEPSLWYGSFELETAFTEVAYYRLKFFDDTSANLGSIEISMTAFTACIVSHRGIDLTEPPFSHYTNYISDKDTHQFSQQLGTEMREEHVEVFIYNSARTHTLAKNVASFTHSVFELKKNQYVNNEQKWKCYANKHCIEFTRIELMGNKRYSFPELYFSLTATV